MAVIIPDRDVLDTKLGRIDISRLHVVADFDKTLTKAVYAGRKHHSSIALVRDGHYLNDDYVQKSHALHAKYYPIEKSATLPKEEIAAMMTLWWREHWELMIANGMSTAVIDDIVSKDVIHEREGLRDFLRLLDLQCVPVLVLSAGIGNIIKGFFERNGLYSSNMKVISNFFEFDENGRAVGYSSPQIHSFNKNEAAIDLPYLEERDQVVLLGDSLGDLGMTARTNHALELRVGFANAAEDQVVFAKHFDIIVTEDGPITPVTDLLTKVIGKEVSGR